MLAGLAVALVVSGVVTWVVGRARQPVDAIRSEGDRITSTDLGRRVPVPPSGDEVTRLATTMNQMLDRPHTAVEQQRRLVADVSHEVRSPIASIRTQLEVAVAHPEDTDRLQVLSSDLLLLARIEAGERVPSEPVDLAIADGISVSGNRSQLERVVGNCSTTRAATPPPPSGSRSAAPPARDRPGGQPRAEGAGTRSKPSGIRHRGIVQRR